MRSKWKPIFLSRAVLRKQTLPAGSSPKIYDKSSVIPPVFEGKRVLIHTGNRFVSLLIRDFHIGYRFGEFVSTKVTGSAIHQDKKKAKKGQRR